MSETSDEDIAYCTAFVKEHANDLYLADLLLPKSYRHDIFVLHAFQAEIGNIILRTQEPTMGEIRLQWWTEVIEGERKGEAQGHPTARALLELMGRHNLPRLAFLRKLEAHQFDLYNDPMGDRTMLEGYLGETHSSIFQMSGIIAGASDLKTLAEASGHAGVLTGLVWVLKNMALHRKQQKVYIPGDLLDAVGLDPQTYLENGASEFHEQTVLALVSLANEHRVNFTNAVKNISNEVLITFNQTAIVDLYLNFVKKRPLESMQTGIFTSQFRKQWLLLKY